MNSSRDEEAGPLQRPVEAQSIDALAESVGDLILRTLTERFGMPPDEADALMLSIFISSTHADVQDREAWLIAAACSAAQAWRRSRGLEDGTPLPPDASLKEIEALRGVALTGKGLAVLPETGREALRLRFREHWTYAEIAAELKISRRYAEILVDKSLARLRAHQRGAGRP